MFGFIPGASEEDTFFYYTSSNPTAGRNPLDFSVWTKPPNAKFVWMLAVGPGGFGGKGALRAAGAAGGGGGGAGGAISMLFSASSVPDTLYIATGLGGRGTGTVEATRLIISADRPVANSTAGWQFVTIEGGAGGADGSSLTPGTGGAAGSVGLEPLLYGCLYYQIISTPAGANGSATSPANLTSFSTFMSQAQGGGGHTGPNGISYAGGTINASSTSTLESLWVSRNVNQTAGQDGDDGMINKYSPFSIIAGMGGAGSIAVAGGQGGEGFMGTGGGGGGGATGSRPDGSNGGNGFVLIKCW